MRGPRCGPAGSWGKGESAWWAAAVSHSGWGAGSSLPLPQHLQGRGGAPCPAVDGLQRCVATQQTPPVSLCTSTLTAQGGHLQVFVVKGKKRVGREEGQGGAAPQAGPGSGGAPEASRSSRHRPASDDPAGNEQNNLGALTTPAEMDEPLEAWQEVDTSEPASQEGECGGQRHIPGQPISGRGTGWELPGEVT